MMITLWSAHFPITATYALYLIIIFNQCLANIKIIIKIVVYKTKKQKILRHMKSREDKVKKKILKIAV